MDERLVIPPYTKVEFEKKIIKIIGVDKMTKNMKEVVHGLKVTGHAALLLFLVILSFRVFGSPEGAKIARLSYEIRELLDFSFKTADEDGDAAINLSFWLLCVCYPVAWFIEEHQ